MREHAMPWYTALLGLRPVGGKFRRLIAELALSSDDDPRSSLRWYENEQGVSVVIREGRIRAIQFYSAENPHFRGFSEPLPLGLSFEMTRGDVRERFGEPDHVFPERRDSSLPHAGIDRYHAPRCTIVIVYSARSDRIEILGFEPRGRDRRTGRPSP